MEKIENKKYAATTLKKKRTLTDKQNTTMYLNDVSKITLNI